VPTACSDIEPLRSIAGDAAILFDPASDESMLDALGRIALDRELRAHLAVAGPRRAAQFSWRKCAEATVDVLLAAARSGSSSRVAVSIADDECKEKPD